MKLIDAPVGVFVFRDEFVLKTEYMTNIDGVYIPDCYILSTGEKFWGGMKSKEDFKTKYNNLDVEVIDIMPSAHLESKRQATNSSDCIFRQDAKDVVDMELDAIDHVPEWVYDRLLTALDKVPSAHSEPIRINLNDPIKVKLTDWGKEIYYHQYDRTNQIIGREVCKPSFPKEDENGYAEFQLWCFMKLYGKCMGMTLPNVIEPLEIVYER